MSSPKTTSVTSSALSWEKAVRQTKPLQNNNKKNAPLFIVVGVAMIFLLASGTWRILHQAPPAKMLKIVVAKADTAAGMTLGFMNLRYMDIPLEFTTKDMLTSLNDVANHTTKTFIPAGEPLRREMLFPAGQSLSQNLDTSERAITLKLDDEQLVDHAICPEDLVDVVVISSKNNQKYAKTVCQAVRVVVSAKKEQAIARHVGGNYDKITLAVSPDVAEVLSEAAEVGKIRLILRSRLSVRRLALDGSDPKDLLPGSAFHVEKEAGKLASTPLLPWIAPPAAPPLSLQPQIFPGQNSGASEAQTAITPLEWVIEMFSGSRKESLSVPQQ